MKNLSKSLTFIGSTTLFALLAAATIASAAPGTARGGANDLARLAESTRGKSAVVAQAEQHQHGSAPACGQCQTVATTATTKDGKQGRTTTVPVQQHLCGGCKTAVAAVGHGKAKTDVVQHTCPVAAAKMATCCAK